MNSLVLAGIAQQLGGVGAAVGAAILTSFEQTMNVGSVQTGEADRGFVDRAGNAASMRTRDLLSVASLGYRYDRLTVVGSDGSSLALAKQNGLGLQQANTTLLDLQYSNLAATSDGDFDLNLSSQEALIAKIGSVRNSNSGTALQGVVDDTIVLRLQDVEVPAPPAAFLRVQLMVENREPVFVRDLPFFVSDHAIHNGGLSYKMDIKLLLKDHVRSGQERVKIHLRYVDRDGGDLGQPRGVRASVGYTRD